MSIAIKSRLMLSALAGAGALLSGCANTPPTQSSLRLSDDFGRAVREDIAAQITDPDPAWKDAPPPPSSGQRAALAQKRYERNAVIQPATSSTTQAVPAGAAAGPGADVGTGGP